MWICARLQVPNPVWIGRNNDRFGPTQQQTTKQRIRLTSRLQNVVAIIFFSVIDCPLAAQTADVGQKAKYDSAVPVIVAFCTKKCHFQWEKL
jgi:hypothetical protein